MGEIRLKIPDTLHESLKARAAINAKRLPDYITAVLRNHIVEIQRREFEDKLAGHGEGGR